MSHAHAPGEGRGWVEFVGLFFIIAGTFNLVAGLTALTHGDALHAESTLVQSLTFWGVTWLVLAVAQAVIGVFVLRRSAKARAWGLGFALAGFFIWIVSFDVHPWWTIMMFLLYGLILYGLTTYREYFR